MKIKISDMLDCSTEIITQEETSEQRDPDRICDLVFERLEIKKKRGKKRCIAIFVFACVLGGCVGAGIILGPGGRVTDQAAFQSEAGFIENESYEDSQVSIKTELIDEQYLYDEQGNQIAKHVIEIDTDYQEDELYLDNGTMLILNNKGDGIKTNVSSDITLVIEQENTNGDPGTVEIGYVLDGKPYCIEKNSNYKTAVTIKGKEGKEYYPYIKNVSSDRIIIDIKYEKTGECGNTYRATCKENQRYPLEHSYGLYYKRPGKLGNISNM